MPPRRRPSTVIAAWLVTGPLGHLWGGLADWLLLARAWARARVRARLRSR
ncbi:MAG: hypothetical protein QOG77_42 [Solirubrobacteraceae bacterium]|nr:hypothetical protein [Solirubrobacteraceae bacterium]